MKALSSKVKYKGKVYIIWAIKTEPVKNEKDKIIYCLSCGNKKIEVTEKELKSS